jgi:GPI mannosyltransferase 4
MPTGPRSRKVLLAWILLILLRLLVALSSTSAIHPDEHFQNPEIAAGLLFDYKATSNALLRTWEWIGAKPCRSIAPVWGSTGLAFALLKRVAGDGELDTTV